MGDARSRNVRDPARQRADFYVLALVIETMLPQIFDNQSGGLELTVLNESTRV